MEEVQASVMRNGMCMYVRMWHTCMHVYIYTYMPIHIHVYTCIQVPGGGGAADAAGAVEAALTTSAATDLSPRVSFACVYVRMYVYIHVCMQVCIYLVRSVLYSVLHVCMYVCIHTSTYIWLRQFLCVRCRLKGLYASSIAHATHTYIKLHTHTRMLCIKVSISICQP